MHNANILSKIKDSTTTFLKLDGDTLSRARLRFQHALYGKLFGKSPPFIEVKTDLLAKWSSFGDISISDLPNGFLLIRCPSQESLQHLLLDGPWSVNGIILQLSPWKPFFEPTFAKLSTAAIWLQLHNLPVEFWEGETLETIASQFGSLLKVDEFTASLSRSKYARICVEVDLSKPLCRGFWIGDDFHRVFVVVLYERLPTFCYSCGMIGHGSNSCSRPVTSGAARIDPSRPVRLTEFDSGLVSEVRDQHMDDSDPVPPGPSSETLDDVTPETNYGPWLLVSRRRGGTRGRGGGSRPGRATIGAAADPSSEATVARGAAPRSLRGGKSLAPSGRQPSLQVNSSVTDAVPHVPTRHDQSNPSLSALSPPPNVLINSLEFQGESSLHTDTLPPSLTNQISPLCLSLDKVKKSLPNRSSSPPPVLITSLQIPHYSPPQPNPSSHVSLVEKVSSALEEEDMEEDNDQDDVLSDDEEDDEMSEEENPEDSPDDAMTLFQYQTEVRREALVRKGTCISSTSPKKGRVDPGKAGP